MNDKHTPTPEIKDGPIVDQFARALISYYMGEAWKWQPGEYELTTKILREKIVRAVNSHEALLEAARAAVAAIHREVEPEGVAPAYNLELLQILEKLGKAIAKAEGKP